MARYHRILVAVDGSRTSDKALAAALEIARDCDARVRLVHAIDELAYLSEYSGDIFAMVREQAWRILDAAAKVATDSQVPAETRLIDNPGQRLGDAIAREAADWGADLIVIGTHGRHGLQRALLGSGAEQIIRLAPVPVLVVRGGRDEA